MVSGGQRLGFCRRTWSELAHVITTWSRSRTHKEPKLLGSLHADYGTLTLFASGHNRAIVLCGNDMGPRIQSFRQEGELRNQQSSVEDCCKIRTPVLIDRCEESTDYEMC